MRDGRLAACAIAAMVKVPARALTTMFFTHKAFGEVTSCSTAFPFD